ncbi:SRPBCC family protein [Pontimicrobium sp. MEBiC01747]
MKPTTMKNMKFTETIEIKCTPEFAFNYTQDYNKRLTWDTFLKQADLIEGASEANKGVKAYCVAKNGLAMTTEYITFNKPKATAIKMIKGPFMFKTFLGSWSFKSLQTNLTEVIFLYSFKLQFPFNLFKRFIKNHLRTNVKQRLFDLKTNIESETHLTSSL